MPANPIEYGIYNIPIRLPDSLETQRTSLQITLLAAQRQLFEKNAPILNTAEIWDIVNDPERGSYRRYASVFQCFVGKAPIQQLTQMAAKVEFSDWLRQISR